RPTRTTWLVSIVPPVPIYQSVNGSMAPGARSLWVSSPAFSVLETPVRPQWPNRTSPQALNPLSMPTTLLIPVRGPRLIQRFVNLILGLILFGAGIGLMLQSRLGVPPWDVLHQGLVHQFGLTIGIWSIITSIVVLIAWVPLREPYGVGTLLNAVIIGISIDLSALMIPEPEAMVWRIVLMAGGILIIGFGSGLYIGAHLGPGPRDGLMTGIARRGPSIRLTRTVLEITVLAIGWMLGGTFGIGTVAFAILVGPIVQFFLPRLHMDLAEAAARARRVGKVW